MTLPQRLALLLALGLLGCTTPPQSAPVRVEAGPPLAWGAGTGDRIHRSNSGFYQIKAADTLWAVAVVHDVDVVDLAKWNDIQDPDVIVVGQKLRLSPPGEQAPSPVVAAAVDENIHGRGAPATQKSFSSWSPTEAAPTHGKPSDKESAKGPLLAPVAVESVNLDDGAPPPSLSLPSPSPPPLAFPVIHEKGVMRPNPSPLVRHVVEREPSETPAEPPTGADVAKSADYIGIVKAPSPKGWRWPVKGKLMQKFGQFGQHRYNGIDIAVAEGTPVAVVAPGIVAYADNGLSSYGNLILVRHGGSFMSAYAHNSAILVKPGQKLAAGQVIARTGSTGSATSAMLHFELRKGIEPVDPLPYLPKL